MNYYIMGMNQYEHIKKIVATLTKMVNELDKGEPAETLYSITQAGNKLKIPLKTLRYDMSRNRIPIPHRQRIGGSVRLYYNDFDLKVIEAFYKTRTIVTDRTEDLRDHGLYTRRMVAEAAGSAAFPFENHIKRGHIPEPTHTHQKYNSNFRYYTKPEAEKIVCWLKQNTNLGHGKNRTYPQKEIPL